MAFKLSAFLSELKRRKVYHVAAAYLAVGTAIVFGIPDLFSAFDLPTSAARVVIILVAVGFPVALVLAWAFEVRPEETKAAQGEDRAPSKGTTEGGRRSIAVLPFLDMSPDGDQQSFCDGMAEELINVFARVEDLLVVSRTSSFVFRERAEDAREIGKQLGVDTILEGSVRRTGEKLRVTAQLVNTEDGFHLWSETFDRTLDDVFAIQDEISSSILTTLLPRFLADGAPVSAKVVMPSPEAYDFYVKGRQAHFTYTEEGSERALHYFALAIELEPDWAAPHAAKAETQTMLLFHSTVSPTVLLPQVRTAAGRAVELDATLGDGLALLGAEKAVGSHDWAGAEADLVRAIELSPNSHAPHLWYGVFLLPALGRHEEARREAELCAELDPLNPAAIGDLLWVSYQSRRYDDALDFAVKTLELAPGYPFAVTGLAMVHEQRGNLEHALEAHGTAVAVTQNHPFYRTQLARSLALAGRTAEAEDILTQVAGDWEQTFASPYYLGTAFHALGETDTAFEWLDRAHESRDPWLVFVGEDPMMDSMRDDPRFDELLRRMNLPQRNSRTG